MFLVTLAFSARVAGNLLDARRRTLGGLLRIFSLAFAPPTLALISIDAYGSFGGFGLLSRNLFLLTLAGFFWMVARVSDPGRPRRG